MVWNEMDVLEQRPKLRRRLFLGVALAVLAAAAGFWGHWEWSRFHAIRVGRQWLEAGRLDRAEVSARGALRAAPKVPEAWQFAADVAWRRGAKGLAVADLEKAASLSHDSPDAVLAWAEAALLAGDVDGAGKALSFLTPAEQASSSRAERAKGELLRRRGSYSEAAGLFQSALDLDRHASAPSVGIDEVPLGVARVSTGNESDHARGVGLLTRWSVDPRWGAQALRELLADAIHHGDQPAASRWALALSIDPRFTLGDIFACLRGTAGSDPRLFQALLVSLKKASGTNPWRVAEVMGSLNRLGRTAETLAWAKSIPSAVSQRPPIATEVAEALRLSGQWQNLGQFADRCEWGYNLEFIGWLYDLVAARHLGESAAALAKWKTIQASSLSNPGQAMVAADLLYGWADSEDAVALLWGATGNPRLAMPALGTLARIYQEEGDAAGQYRVFTQMSALRPEDRDIGNNFAYFAVVNGQPGRIEAVRIARANFEASPDNVAYRSTWALVLCGLSRPVEAMQVLEPVAAGWKDSRTISWAYVVALADVGRKAEARTILRTGPIDPTLLSAAEIAWMRSVLL
jgi:tetratricopeptide (TPR) repeat protein